MGIKKTLYQPSSQNHNLWKDTAAGEGAIGLEQLGSDINSLAFHCLAVVSQRKLVKVRQHNLRNTKNKQKVRADTWQSFSKKKHVQFTHTRL